MIQKPTAFAAAQNVILGFTHERLNYWRTIIDQPNRLSSVASRSGDLASLDHLFEDSQVFIHFLFQALPN